MFNKTILIGRTTKDVDLRKTTSGKAVASFTLAVENRYVLKDNKPTTDFISCVAWNKTAEIMDKYVKKGTLIVVEGRIQTRNYDDKNGNKVYVTEVVCENMRMLGSKEDSKETPVSNQAADAYNDTQYSISDDDLPF